MILKKIGVLVLVLISILSSAQHRKNLYIPDIQGYQTLKCDFHIHTVFSDGDVWPTVRVEEAWLEGLDAIAISDHIEYTPHSADINADFNRSYEIAQPVAESLGVLLIKAAEITRNMPPGHLNTLFIKNANLLERENYMDALVEAKEQGAFIFWNHPGWEEQQPDTTLWWDEHTELFNKGMLHGIEVVNHFSYYPEALGWANEKGLAVLCNSDVHTPVNMVYDLVGSHRPMTLVFAKQKSMESLKEALFAKRTVAYIGNKLYGSSQYMQPLFFNSIKIVGLPVQLQNRKVASVMIKNISDIDYELELVQPPVGFECAENVVLKAHHSTRIELTGNSDEVANMEELLVYYTVKNITTAPGENLVVTLKIHNK